jgi:hypothetical protein
MRTLIASLPILSYGAALVLGLLGVELPFASAELSPLVQWLLFLSLGLVSLWSAFSRGSHRRHGAQQELRHQQCRSDLLVGHPHSAPLLIALVLRAG